MPLDFSFSADSLTHFGWLVLYWALPVVFAITLHEVAHGAMAGFLGDDTARKAHRLSLNPLRHIDPLGSVLVPLILLVLGDFVFGWARPVPVDHRVFDKFPQKMLMVVAAGPLANFMMSLLWALVMLAGYRWMDVLPGVGAAMIYMGAAGIFINSAVMMLNLLPLPPLDGGRMLCMVLPGRYQKIFARIEPWGLFVMVVLILTGLAAALIWPMMVANIALVTWLVDTPFGLFIQAMKALLGQADLVMP